MTKLLTILVISVCLFLGGCGYSIAEQERRAEKKIPNGVHDIVVVDSCEYFQTFNRDGTIYTHKGNCKNPIHYCNERLTQAEKALEDSLHKWDTKQNEAKPVR